MSFVLSVIYAFEIYIYAGEFIGYVYLAFIVVFMLTVINAILVNKYCSNFSEKTNEMTGFVYELFGGMENVKLNNAGFIAFLSLYGLFIGSVGGVYSVLNAAAEFNSSYNQLKAFFTAEIEKTEKKQSIDNFDGNVEFSNVSFKYSDSSNYILENIKFSIKKDRK